MKISIEAKPFAQALQFAGRVIDAKPVWPIMSNIKLIANDASLTLIGTNGDTTLEMDSPATVLTSGAVCVPFDTLAKFVAAAKGGTVEIEQSGSGVTVKSGRGRIVLSGARVEEFPLNLPAPGEPVTMDAASLCSALRFCVAAASDSEVQYHLKGVCLRENSGLEFWGTDGHRMHHAKMQDQPGIGGGGIIPTDAVAVISSIIEKADLAHMLVTETGWHVVCGPVRAFGKVIDGSYPDCSRPVQMFSKSATDVLSASRDDLIGAITVASVGANADVNKSRSMVLRADKGGPLVARGLKGVDGVLHAGRAETEAVALVDFSGVANAAYLTATINTMGAPNVVLSYSSEGGFLVRPAQDSATMRMFALIVGIRVSDAEMADAA